jgi:hypothetical protein
MPMPYVQELTDATWLTGLSAMDFLAAKFCLTPVETGENPNRSFPYCPYVYLYEGKEILVTPIYRFFFNQ